MKKAREIERYMEKDGGEGAKPVWLEELGWRGREQNGGTLSVTYAALCAKRNNDDECKNKQEKTYKWRRMGK